MMGSTWLPLATTMRPWSARRQLYEMYGLGVSLVSGAASAVGTTTARSVPARMVRLGKERDDTR